MKNLIIFSVRLPSHWLKWIKARFKPSTFIRDAVLKEMWERGYDPDRKEELSD